MKILVTGGSGMVGRNVLADRRAGTHAILAPSRAELDLTDGAATLAFVIEHQPDLILNLAAVVGGIQANIDSPDRFLAENLAIGLNVLEAARLARTLRLINLGTSCMYPAGLAGPLRPSQLLSGPLEPTNEAYGRAKLATWELTLAVGRGDTDRIWTTLIPPNLYGPHDHFDAVRSHLIPAIIVKIEAALATGAEEVEIWGDGTARREFMFAADLADFLWRFHGDIDHLPETMNVGVGQDHSVIDYYHLVADVMGYRGRFTHDLGRPAGVSSKLLDIAAQRKLGWLPKTPLRQGIAATVAFYREQRSVSLAEAIVTPDA